MKPLVGIGLEDGDVVRVLEVPDGFDPTTLRQVVEGRKLDLAIHPLREVEVMTWEETASGPVGHAGIVKVSAPCGPFRFQRLPRHWPWKRRCLWTCVQCGATWQVRKA